MRSVSFSSAARRQTVSMTKGKREREERRTLSKQVILLAFRLRQERILVRVLLLAIRANEHPKDLPHLVVQVRRVAVDALRVLSRVDSHR
jgi:hypothetical protein